MKKLICLLLALTVLLAAGLAGTAESPAADGSGTQEEMPGEELTDDEDAEDEEAEEEAGDDTEQIPLELSEDGEGEENVLQMRPLTDGDEGDDVLFLQLRLQSLQYFAGEADGRYGQKTAQAVSRFQADNAGQGLDDTGVADIATQMLLATTQYRALRYGSQGEDVRELQQKLTELGYYSGRISGEFLEGSQNGIKQFQKNNGLEVTGVADARTQEALYAYGAIGKTSSPAEPTPAPVSGDAFYVVTDDENTPIMPNAPVAYSRTLKNGMTKSDLVLQLQERMKQLGYYDGPVSGNFMNKTLAAVKKIQNQNGIKATGTVDEETWNLIFNSPAIVMPNATAKPSPTPEPVRYAITVDVKNQVVIVYGRDDQGGYTVPVRYMLCSSGKVGTPSPVGDWVLNGRKAKWCYFPKWGDYARYWTRINAQVAFHSPIYSEVSTKGLKVSSYEAIGRRASHGCIRLLLEDAKWIYDNVGAGTVVTITETLPKNDELKSALLAEKPDSPNSSPVYTTPEPEYSRDAVPKLRSSLGKGSKGADVYWVQRRLSELGYYTTKCTGTFKTRTDAAVRAFQKDHGLYQSGKVDQKTINAMAEAN